MVRQMHSTEGGLTAVRKFGATLNWTLVYDKYGCVAQIPGRDRIVKDTVVVWRMPLPPTWQQRAYNAFWASGFG